MIGTIGLFFDIRRSIAEFAMMVRTDQKRQGLGKMGCDLAQGFALARPCDDAGMGKLFRLAQK